MKLLDLRPWPNRLALSLWQGKGITMRGETSTPNSPGHGFGSFISLITRRRIKNRPPVPARPFIVSVGNLALGGTGKTPVVSALARDLSKLGFTGAILTRGYRSPLPGPVVVDPDLANAGDEARLLAREIQPAGWIVVQAKNRLAGLTWLQEHKNSLDVIIAEDAHQTPNLPRHLDILIIDRWHIVAENNKRIVSAVSGPIFPLGPYREDSRGADRAGIWLLENEDGHELQSQLGPRVAVTTFSREVVLPKTEDNSAPYGVLSGIARPWRFEKSMKRLMGYDPALAVRCNDHDSYGPDMIQRIITAATEAKIERVLTTAKDWVKLQEVWPRVFPLHVAELEISWGVGKTLPELVRERLSEFSKISG